MADDFNGQQKPCQPPHRTEKMLQITNARVFESLRLVIDKSANCQSQWDYGNGSGGFKAGNDSNQVGYQNEETERHKKGRKPFTVMSNDFMALVFDEPVGALEDMLQSPRLVDREPRPHHGKDNT